MATEQELSQLILACKTDDQQAKALALEKVAQARMDLKQPEEALVTVTQALEIARSTKDKTREAALLLIGGPAHMEVGSHVPALKVAKEAVVIYGELGNKAKEAEAAISLARLHNDATKLGDLGGAEASAKALQLAKAAGEKKLEASASLEVARAQLLQVKDASTAQRAADEALTSFKALGDKSGEASASELLAKVYLAMSDAEKAIKAATDAYEIYKALKDKKGTKSAYSTLEKVRASRYAITPARLMVEDKTAVAIIEMSPTSSQESLMMIIDTLKAIAVRGWTGLKAVCVMIEGKDVPDEVVAPLLSTGTFCVGLKSIGVPIAGCVWGVVSGAAWQAIMACDYRISCIDTVYRLPIQGSPSVLAKLIGSHLVAELMMTQDTLLAQNMQEMGFLHASMSYADEAQKMCLEFGRRIAGFPQLAARETINLMNPDPMEFFVGTTVDEE